MAFHGSFGKFSSFQDHFRAENASGKLENDFFGGMEALLCEVWLQFLGLVDVFVDFLDSRGIGRLWIALEGFSNAF